jgi:hypothetical protein
MYCELDKRLTVEIAKELGYCTDCKGRELLDKEVEDANNNN